MKCKYEEVIPIWLLIEKGILRYSNGLNKKNIPENLQSNVVKVKSISRKTSLTPIHENENILVQSVYLKKICRIPFDLPKYGK